MKHTLLITDMNVCSIMRTKSTVVSADEADRVEVRLRAGETVRFHGLKLKPTKDGQRFRVFYV